MAEMRVKLVSMGCGDETLTTQAREALEEADCLVGADRLLREAPARPNVPRLKAVRGEEILSILRASGAKAPCVLLSGDAGFYSAAAGLVPLLEGEKIPFEVLPGVSSLQAFAARLHKDWQGWNLYSAHGRNCDPVAAVCQGKPAFFLTGGTLGSAELCGILTRAGLGELRVDIGENLFCKGEKLYTGTAAECAKMSFAPLSVLLVQPAPRPSRRTPGIPDEEFLRDKVPMTKQEVRAAILAKLAVAPNEVCWDVGAGTGSVSVELALQCREAWALEREERALALIEENRKKFGAWNLQIKAGEAPESLKDLPAPDKVFIGGSGGRLREIVSMVSAANPNARVCISAIALETLHTALAVLQELGYEAEVAQISVSRARKAGELHLLMAQNPVFLITGERP